METFTSYGLCNTETKQYRIFTGRAVNIHSVDGFIKTDFMKSRRTL